MQNILKYLVEGLAVSIAVYLVNDKTNPKEIFAIAFVGALTFAVLDMFAPAVSGSARTGAGFGLGAMHVGFPEGFSNSEIIENLKDEYNMKLKGYKIYGEQEEEVLVDEQIEKYSNLDNENSMSDEYATFSPATQEELKKENELMKNNRGSNNEKLLDGYENSDLLVGSRNIGSHDMKNNMVAEYFTVNETDNYNEQNEREGGVLHSGDIVNIVEYGSQNDSIVMQRDKVSSDVVMKEKLKDYDTNLSKLRFVLTNENGTPVSAEAQYPITYGSTVYIRHNAYEQGYNKNFNLAMGANLQSHQNLDESINFGKLIIEDPDNKENTSAIRYGNAFVLKYETIESGRLSGYLHLNTDSASEMPQNALYIPEDSDAVEVPSEAVRFTTKLVRPHELGNKQLYVGPSGVLFP